MLVYRTHQGDIAEARGSYHKNAILIHKLRVECSTYCRYIQYIRILVFVQSRRVHLFIVSCLLKNKFNTHVRYSSLIVIDDNVLQFP